MIGNTIGKSGAARWTKILLASTVLGSGGAGVASAIALSSAISLAGVNQAFSAPPDSNDYLIDGASDTWSSNRAFTDDLIIGLYTQGAVLTIDSGAKVTVGDNVIIAGNGGSQGTVVVTGLGSELNVLRTGTGDKTLNIGGGGDGYAAVPIYGGDGTLRIENGGKADAKYTYVGYGQKAKGTLVVTGQGSSLTTDELRLSTGLDATGSSTITIANGGSIATNSVETFGKGSSDHLSANVLVTGEGSKWVNAGNFKLGGDMTIENGASVTTSTAEIGNSIINENTLYLTGDKSSFNVTDRLTIEDGNLSVANGAKLNVANGIKLTGENGYLTIGGKIDMSDVFDEPKPLAAEAAGSINKEAVITFGSTKSEGHLSFNHTGTGSNAYTMENALVGDGIITALAGETILSGDLTKFYSTAGRLGGGVVVDGDTAKLVLKGDLGTAASDPHPISPTRTSFRVNNGSLVLGGATGQMVANNSYYSSVVDVNAKGWLEGWGTVGSTDVNGGVISPGTSDNRIGTITVKGNLTFYANSNYNVDIAGNGTSDKIVVESVNQNGVADIKNNVNVNVTALDAAANYQTGQTYTILTAAGGITGQFAQAASQSAFLDVSLDQQANQVDLKIKVKQDPGGQNPGGQNPGGQNPGGQNPGGQNPGGQNPGGQNPGGQNPGGQPSRPGPNVSGPFDDVTETHNQYETAVALNSLPQDGGAGHALYNALLPLNAADGRAAFEQLSGEVHASGATALINSSQYVRNAANDRVRAAFGDVAAASLPVMAYGPDGKDIEAATTARTAAWGQVFGAWSSIDGDGNAS
uniref:autotransporter outer membrane beta-barrel domain-containing protein n=1 Tax=Mesorhizobium amorphae TaxID=71433 RepID=UPI0016427014